MTQAIDWALKYSSDEFQIMEEEVAEPSDGEEVVIIHLDHPSTDGDMRSLAQMWGLPGPVRSRYYYQLWNRWQRSGLGPNVV